MGFVRIEALHDGIIRLTLNRPEAANALSIALLSDLENAIQQVRQNKQIRCVILTGQGDKAFCAGADLKERKEMTDTETVAALKKISGIVRQVEQIEVPVITAINGVAFGGGLELALATDIRIASAQSQMGLTETALAIIPGAGGTQRLPRIIGAAQAKYLIYTSKRISAEEASRLGLIERSVDLEYLQEECLQLAKQITANGPLALRQAKKAINQGLDASIEKGLEVEHAAYLELISTQDRQEGLLAFQEKRKPDYQGK